MSEWIKWKGGECPVSPDTVVDAIFKDGSSIVAYAYSLRWGHVNKSTDIVEYREAPALSQQEGGDHYKKIAIQPVEYIHRNGIGFCEGSAIKYLTLWRDNGGIEDLRKAKHFIDLLIELETKGE